MRQTSPRVQDVKGDMDSTEFLRVVYKAIDQVITEYLVNISKRRAFWSLNEDILKIYYSEDQYAVSVPALTKDHKGKKINTPYPEEVNTPY
ncbi:hypothetical protein Tco_1124098 [Tanacetum coccineum]|uniref:Uncharacterized protein n=1 Tax=Tanacetum coccineum TaxID=301880 RepID=A0ABQ5J865_9ASTR